MGAITHAFFRAVAAGPMVSTVPVKTIRTYSLEPPCIASVFGFACCWLVFRYTRGKPVDMGAPKGLLPIQERYWVLTHDCGLEHEEALHALGRRTGGFPEYRKLSRLEQHNKIEELVSRGLTRLEAERVLGASPAHQGGPLPASSVILDVSDAALLKIASRKSKPGKPPGQCFNCKQPSSDLGFVPERVWLCGKCRKLLRKARKARKRRSEFSSYYDALTQPESRGLKGIRK